jgi:hypothetical protein
MRDQEYEQPHVPCGAEELVQDVKSDLVWDLNQPKADVVYELFETFLLFWSYYKTQVQNSVNSFNVTKWNLLTIKFSDSVFYTS